MKKLTAEKCRERIKKFKRLKKQFGIAMETELSLQAFEIALPILEQQERGEGDVWIHWNGEMALPPVDSHVRVEVKRRNGETSERQAKWFAWPNGPVKSGFDIIAYRVIPKHPTNQTGDQ